MQHFSIDDWVDFARQVESPERKIKMQQHLDTGCAECMKTLEIWRCVVDCANQENRGEPPAWAVQTVNASFAMRKIAAMGAGKLELATLLFDSSGQPAAAGVRGTPALARQLLYRSGSVCIDMHMHAKPGSDSTVLIGQLLDSAKPDHGISGISVRLVSNGDIVSQGRTNDVGEFDFGIAGLNCLQLIFGIDKNRTIVVPVPDGESGRGLT